jgi:hypothetical protein
MDKVNPDPDKLLTTLDPLIDSARARAEGDDSNELSNAYNDGYLQGLVDAQQELQMRNAVMQSAINRALDPPAGLWARLRFLVSGPQLPS